MNQSQAIDKINKLSDYVNAQENPPYVCHAMIAEMVVELLGKDNQFSDPLETAAFYLHHEERESENRRKFTEILNALKFMVENGALNPVTLKRQAEIDVTSDFLGIAQDLLQDAKGHPAPAAMIIGASLEEFLRNWTEELKLKPPEEKSIIEYSKILKKEGKISKLDMKNITAWSDLRNKAAHGDFDHFKNPDEVRIMLAGVNLFLSFHNPETRNQVPE